MENTNKLYRSNTDKVIGGVSGGLADYLNIDVVIIRILFVLLALFGGGGVLIYIILWIAIPAQTVGFTPIHDVSSSGTTDEDTTGVVTNKQSNTALGAGIILIIIGLLFLADRLMPFYNLIDFWPVILIAAGVIIIKPDLFKPSKKLES